MRALINTAPLYGKGAGARTYTAGLLTALAASAVDMEWDVLVREADYQRLGLAADPRFHRLAIGWPPAPPTLRGARFLWRNAVDQVIIPYSGRKYDVIHYLDSYGPLWGAGRTPFALTVHDVFPITHPEYFKPWVARYLAALMRVIPRASALMAISEQTARDLTERFGIALERIRVIHNGVDARFHPATADERRAALRKYGVNSPYFLAVGTVEARKNLSRIIRAFEQARSGGAITQQLLIAGKAGYGYDEIVNATREPDLNNAARLLGYVPDEDVVALMSGADALIYISLAEGFGLPVIEGMACGAPVITSHTGALAEVAGNAAYLVDPEKQAGIAAALMTLGHSAEWRARLRLASLERAKAFSWGAVAEATVTAYREAVARGVMRPS
ncbi:MAG TPA: glycosyltransferase family 1 protein [Ktedonobacterales bacterium]